MYKLIFVALALAVGPAAAGDPPLPFSSTAAAQPVAAQPACAPAKDGAVVRRVDCTAVPGHGYDNGNLRDTGGTGMADALQRLDPSVTISHH